MIRFKARAFNSDGFAFRFTFVAYNWNGIETVARAALDALIAGDRLHQDTGPWDFDQIDRAA